MLPVQPLRKTVMKSACDAVTSQRIPHFYELLGSSCPELDQSALSKAQILQNDTSEQQVCLVENHIAGTEVIVPGVIREEVGSETAR